MQRRVLVVDDDRLIRELVRETLVGDGYQVSLAASGTEALARMSEEGAFDLLLTDLSMREMDGLSLIEQVKRRHPKTDVVILTGYASLESALQAMRLGAADYLRKPAKPAELLYCVNRTVLRRQILAENEELRHSVQAFEASRVLTSCMEASDILPMAIDILLQLLGRSRAVGRLLYAWPRVSDGIYLQGFSDSLGAELREQIEQGKLFDPTGLETVGCRVPEGVRRNLERLGIEDDDLLVVPVKPEGRVSGALWVFSDGRPFLEEETRRAELVVAQSQLALVNAERFLQARERAFVDDVTDLYNARYLFTSLDREVSRAARSQLELSVLFLDLDRFKRINDEHGHLVGSRVLREFGQLLHGLVRSIDTVVRYGGDEFTIVLVDTRLSGAMHVAERIRRTTETHIFGTERGLELRVTVSVGVGTFPQHGRDREHLIDSADKAMYLGKSLGRNRVCSSDDLPKAS